MTTLADIERKARLYHQALAELGQTVDALEAEIAEAKLAALADIRTLAAEVAYHRAEVLAAVAAQPDLFARPKSREFHRIKLGYRKAPGKVLVPDAARVVAAIKRLLPRKKHRLIKTTETPDKSALSALPAHELKKLGCHVVDATDEPFVKPVEGEVEKLAAALLDEGNGGS